MAYRTRESGLSLRFMQCMIQKHIKDVQRSVPASNYVYTREKIEKAVVAAIIT